MYILNLKDNNCEWKRVVLSKPPESRHQHTLVGDDTSKNSSMKYLFGGINTPDNVFFNDLWALDLSTMIYDSSQPEVSGIRFVLQTTTGSRPRERKGHCSFIYKKKMFVFGGQTQDIQFDTMHHIFFMDVEKFHWSSFENKSAEISPRSLFSCSWYNDSTLIVNFEAQA